MTAYTETPPSQTEEQREHMREWVRALRSGKYGQTQKTLKRGDNDYCCLGVACEISGLGKWSLNSKIDMNNWAYLVKPSEEDKVKLTTLALRWDLDDKYVSSSILPGVVADYFGVSNFPMISSTLGAAVANDSGEWDFHRIASALEDYYQL